MPIQKDIERSFKSMGFVIKFKTFTLENTNNKEIE
jgi:hypothetical protein